MSEWPPKAYATNAVGNPNYASLSPLQQQIIDSPGSGLGILLKGKPYLLIIPLGIILIIGYFILKRRKGRK
jgi:hypothetical protein